jgi:hypothetical protein
MKKADEWSAGEYRLAWVTAAGSTRVCTGVMTSVCVVSAGRHIKLLMNQRQYRDEIKEE